MIIPDYARGQFMPVLSRLFYRLWAGVVVLWASLTLVFVAFQFIPGDPVKIIAGPGAVLSPDAITALRQQFGLNLSVTERYVHYFIRLAHGDLGSSYASQQPVTALISGQLGSSIVLTGVALAIAWGLVLLWICLTASRSPGLNSLGRSVEIISSSLPDFWVGLLLITLFAFRLHWFPVIGTGWRGIVLPSLALAIPLAGFLGQIIRQSFDDAMKQPFALSVRARGSSSSRLRVLHVLRHAVLPGISLSNWAVGWLLGGSVAIEQIFARQGIGNMILDAVQRRDLPVIMGIVAVIAVSYIIVNIVTDILIFFIGGHRRTSEAGEI